MLRVTAGHDIEYPLRSAGSAVAYYLKDGKEPPGAWAGTAAGALGLTGQVDPEVYRALAAPKTARRTTRAGSLAREVAASSALLLYFAAVRDDKRPIPHSESAFGVGALGGTRTPNLLIRSSMCGRPDPF